jgi:transposase
VQFAAPFRKSNKNDFNDAEAIAEAAVRGHMRFFPLKSVEELDLQALDRARDRLIRERTVVDLGPTQSVEQQLRPAVIRSA